MCFSRPKYEEQAATTTAVVPAPAPAPALPPADVPKIGEARRKETAENFGTDAPQYRTNRNKKPRASTTNKQITM